MRRSAGTTRGLQVYGPLYRSVIFPVWESRYRGRSTLDHLEYLRASEWSSPGELAAIQAAELGRLLRHAYAHVPLYRERFDAAGVSPDDIRTPADLALLPLLTRANAQEAGPRRRSLAPPFPTIAKRTSGSTGQPLEFAYDEESEWWRQAVRMRGYGWAGYRQGDRTLHLWGFRPAAAGKSLSWRIVDRIWVSTDRMLRHEYWADSNLRSAEHFARVVALIRRKRPRTIVCYAQGGAELARYVVATGARTWGTIPVLCGAEKLFPDDRRSLEEAFGQAIFETYGNREVMLIATECELHRGLHVQAENVVVEVVVRDEAAGSERPARPGEVGEVVLTDLHNLGMPFIRYVVGDLATAADGTPCPCGRGLPMLADVVGRTADTLVDGNGQEVGGMALMTLFVELASVVRQYQAVQRRDRSITLRLVATTAFDAVARARIAEHCQHYLPGIPVSVELVDEIPLAPSGKRRFIIVENE